jgi:hypothetical protein
MTITYVGQANGSDGTGATSTTIATSSTFNLTTGDHVFVHVRWEETSTTCSVADDNGGGNSYTGLTTHNSTAGTDAYSKLFYCLAANGGATTTWTATFGAARAYRSIRVMVFSSTGALTYDSVDVGGSDNGTVTTVTASPFNMTADGLVIAGSVTFSNDDPVSFVGDVGGTYQLLAEAFNYCAEGYLITTALTGEDVTFTGTNVGRRAISVMAFYEGTPPPPPRIITPIVSVQMR